MILLKIIPPKREPSLIDALLEVFIMFYFILLNYSFMLLLAIEFTAANIKVAAKLEVILSWS